MKNRRAAKMKVRWYHVYNHDIGDVVYSGTREECTRYMALNGYTDYLELLYIGEKEYEPVEVEPIEYQSDDSDEELDDLMGIL